jgi:hypothetical protein
LLLPVHWRVALDHVELVGDAKLGVSSDEAHAIWQAVEPLLHDDGFTGFRVGEHWMLAHDDFALTHTSSIDRACGHAVEDHRPHGPAASRWGRLQNEIQMLLHNHPVNDARDERGQLPINSLWLSGTGRLDPAVEAPSDDVQLELRLREPALRGDLAAWLDAWQTIDRERIAPLLNEPAARLTLCSIDRAPTLAPRRLPWWQRWRKPAPVNLDALWTPA